MQDMQDKRPARLIWVVTKSTLLSAAMLLAVVAALSAWMTSHRYAAANPYMMGSWQAQFEHYLVVGLLNVYIQLAIAFSASVALALYRRKHHVILGVLGGLVILGLDASGMWAHDHLRYGMLCYQCLWFAGIPLTAAALQLIPIPRKTGGSNMLLESGVTPQLPTLESGVTPQLPTTQLCREKLP